MHHWWMGLLSFLSTMITIGNILLEPDDDVLDAIVGEPLLVKTWTGNHLPKSIDVLKGKSLRLTVSFFKTNLILSKDNKGDILLEYNNATRAASLILETLSKENAAKYTVEETLADTSPNLSGTQVIKWNFWVNVIDPSEISQCNVGGNISMTFIKTSISDHLYYYDQRVANLLESDCHVLAHSHLYGRLWCIVDKTRLTISIENVTQRDTGLYTVSNNNNNDSQRSYINVTDETTNATIGENVTIDWFYSQQAINRTLRVIHSNNGIMMTLQPNNEPHIVPTFQMRIVYKGDVSRCYMSFTLINIAKSDSGVYKIETLHGTTASGCKRLNVVGENYAHGVPSSARETTKSTPALTECTTTDSSSTIGPSLLPTTEILNTKEYTTSLSLNGRLTSPAHPIITSSLLVDVVIGAMGILIMMIGCLIWIQWSNRRNLKAVQRQVLETSSSRLISTSAIRTQLPTSIVDEGLCRLIISTPVGNVQSEHKYRSFPDSSLSFDTQSSFAMSVPILEDDKYGLTCQNIVASKESNEISIQTLPYASDNALRGLLEDCRTVCVSGSAASNAAVDLSPREQFPHYLYAKVKKGPRSTSKNNNQFAFSSVPDGECSNWYNMVNYTRGYDPKNTFQTLEIVSESTIPVNVSLQAEKDNTRSNYVRDAKDDGYETCGNIKHMTFIEHAKVSEDEGAVTIKDQGPMNCIIPHVAMHRDYADIDI